MQPASGLPTVPQLALACSHVCGGSRHHEHWRHGLACHKGGQGREVKREQGTARATAGAVLARLCAGRVLNPALALHGRTADLLPRCRSAACPASCARPGPPPPPPPHCKQVLGTPRNNSVALVRMLVATIAFSSFVNNTPGGASGPGTSRVLWPGWPVCLPCSLPPVDAAALAAASAAAWLGPLPTPFPASCCRTLPAVVCILLPIVLTWATKSKVGGSGRHTLILLMPGGWPADCDRARCRLLAGTLVGHRAGCLQLPLSAAGSGAPLPLNPFPPVLLAAASCLPTTGGTEAAAHAAVVCRAAGWHQHHHRNLHQP